MEAGKSFDEVLRENGTDILRDGEDFFFDDDWNLVIRGRVYRHHESNGGRLFTEDSGE